MQIFIFSINSRTLSINPLLDSQREPALTRSLSSVVASNELRRMATNAQPFICPATSDPIVAGLERPRDAINETQSETRFS
jgi:hypothetical protein